MGCLEVTDIKYRVTYHLFLAVVKERYIHTNSHSNSTTKQNSKKYLSISLWE